MKAAIFTVILLMSSFARAEVMGVTCANEPESKLPLLNTALHNLYSFEYVRTALAQIRADHPDVEFCTSGMILSRNIYQYPKVLIRVEAREKATGTSVKELRLLFQDASTQALDNIGVKPWVGLPKTRVDILMHDFVASLAPAPVSSEGSFDPAAIAQNSATYKMYAVDLATFSVMPVAPESYLVSWLTLPGGNPFANYPMLKGVLVRRDVLTGKVSLAENLWLTRDVDFEIDKLWTQGFPSHGEDLGQYLLTE